MSDDSVPSAPPGWYPDPDGSGERWWTGRGWGEHDRNDASALPDDVEAYTPPPQEPASQTMRCHNCGGTEFLTSEYLLSTRGMSLFDLDAFNAGATCLTCRRCRYIHWFAPGV